ncbi:FCD domain-containing protein [Amycolatopsis sp. WQ 127309]|uniref:FCD domain-containing protein n=1 Tax=Amycolatopsis sp. WQ 127309 TaxID=2932773 RepID=UPI001FF1E018|nr:FCD domain-containing protein [Amycolatopsis sp. WQ 127309]UOZ04286.1 FCD domain-containing protein [Amycolatopsis sp. WQ 127309]
MSQGQPVTTVNAAGNTVPTESYDTLRSRRQRAAVRVLEARPERPPVVDAEHRALVAALDRHDAEEALDVLDRHLPPVSEVVSAPDRNRSQEPR